MKTSPQVEASDIQTPDQTLDITAEVCPMTFVKTRLALDRLASGQTLLVLLRGEEPRRNVPRTATEQGHAVLTQETDPAGLTRLLLRRK
ncbi:sulfurtransferase TusA family protein [Limobrevibacterium gyesilva]|uniref:Sulfurtransferase TusA family protein n=1 Tax=Limobrevibacterium gyesilva TaxID=2991712 RepID=A0AA41YJ74_9PROT|nr:sulfurtransferase TusA family protein [Limobrevibacterium gyesilva]MCW3474636.1 sulfurtransferase TusA family protein [Limobrevibacterium gyesilva]